MKLEKAIEAVYNRRGKEIKIKSSAKNTEHTHKAIK